jgi:outer membrane protein
MASAIVLLGLVAGSSALALDLNETYRNALRHDARFAAARAARDAGVEKLPQGRAQLLPTVTLNGARTRYDASIEYEGTTGFQGGSRRYTNEEYELRLSQPLYRKQNWAAYKQGEAQTAMAVEQFAAARHELILRVAQVYFDLLAALDGLSLARAQREALVAQHGQARARLAAGTAAITEVHETKARADLATAQEIGAQSAVAVRAKAFWKVTGIEPASLAALREDIALHTPEPNNANDWIEKAKARNPELRAMREGLKAAEQELARARAGHYPTLDLVAGYTEAESTGSVYTSAASDSSWKSAGLQLQFPLYQGGYVSSRVREAAANRDRAREELEDASREIVLRTQQAFLEAEHGALQVSALREAVASSDLALAATRAGLQVGTRNVVDFLNATQQLYSAKRDYSRVRYGYLLGLLKLEASAGQLADEHLEKINGLLR